MDLFADLSDDQLNKIARLLKEQKFAENDAIFAQDEPGDALYIVLQGRVRIATDRPLRPRARAGLLRSRRVLRRYGRADRCAAFGQRLRQ